MQGRKQSKLGAGLQYLPEQFSEAQAIEVMRSTESRIDPTQSQYNISFKACGEPGKYEKMTKTYEAVNDARIKAGKRRMRSDANIGFMGALQKAMMSGGQVLTQSKAWRAKNTDKARKPLKSFYKYMFDHSGAGRPDLHDSVESATLHVDESNHSHVDFFDAR